MKNKTKKVKVIEIEQWENICARIHETKHKLNSLGHSFQDCLPSRSLKHLEKSIDEFYKFMDKVGIKTRFDS